MSMISCFNRLRVSFFFALILITSCSQDSSSPIQGYIEGEYRYLGASVSGRLTHLYVHRGQHVTAGARLFTLQSQPESFLWKQNRATWQQAKAQLADLKKGERQPVLDAIVAQIQQAKAEYQLATLRLKRAQQLFKKGAVDKDDLQQAQAEYDKDHALIAQYQANLANAKLASRSDLIAAQEAAVDAAEQQRRQAYWQLKQKTVYAPTGGIIFDSYYQKGEYTTAGEAVIALLADNDKRIIFFVPETQLKDIRLGEVVHTQGKHGEAATISYISPSAEYTPPVVYSNDNNAKLVYQIKARLADHSRLHPGQAVLVQLNHAE